MDAIDLLISDHAEVSQMFQDFEAETDPVVRAWCAEKICKSLTVHMMVEEELFYPEARKVLDSGDEDLVDEAEHEHSEAKDMIADIKTMATGSDLDDKMADLREAIEHHVGEEEDELFPLLQQLGMETTNLGVQMESRKKQLMSTVK